MSIINDVLVNKLFKDPPKRTKEIPLLSEKTASGDGMVFINDAYSDFPIKNLTLQGNTKQDSTTGAQLFDISSATIGAVSRTTGENLEYGANWKRSDYIQVVSGQQYSCTYVANYQDTGFAFYDEQKTFLSGIPCTTNFTVPESAVFCRITVNTRDGNPNIFMFNAGSTALPWEPYTGGKPSPSPDYPQEIKNVGKWNEETQKYEVDVKVTGKNLLDIDNPLFIGKSKDYELYTPRVENGIIYSGGVIGVSSGKYLYIKVKKGIYSISGVQSGESLNYECGIFTNINNEGYITDLRVVKTKTGITGRFSIDNIYVDVDGYLCFAFYSKNQYGSSISNLQFELESASTSYEPYLQPQSITITSDSPITKWDKLVEQDGQIGWLYKAVFDSDVRPSRMDLFPSGFSLYKDHPNGVFTYKASFAKKEIGWQTSVCKQFKNVDGSYSKGGLFYYSDHPSIDLVYFNSNFETVESFVEYFEQNPLEIVYKSRESEFIPLQQSEQDAIRALTTYYPTTVVTVDGGELPVGIEVTYMHPEYIPTKQSALRMWFKENPII